MNTKSRKRDKLTNRLFSWIEEFMKFRHLQIAHMTYRWGLRTFARYLEKNLNGKSAFPLTITQKTIVRYLKEREAHCTFQSTVMQITWISGFLSYLETNGFLKENPLRVLQEKYGKKGLARILRALLGPSPRKSLDALKPIPQFGSPLGQYMKKFISLHRALGKKYCTEEFVLCNFDRFLQSYSNPPKQLSEEIISQWFNLYPNHKSSVRYGRFCIIRQFCFYLRRFDPVAYVPDPLFITRPKSDFLAYIYSKKEIKILLKGAHKLKLTSQWPLRPQMMYLLILLFYTMGLRLGEALRLRLGDIDWKDKILYIRQTKFFKSRALPFSQSILKELKYFLKLRQLPGISASPESFLFQRPYRDKPYSEEIIKQRFADILRSAGLKPDRGYNGPRLHDLRHTFAVHRVIQWYKKDENLQSKLGFLSTFMGHARISSTQKYLRMTSELLQEASQRYDQYFNHHQKSLKCKDIGKWNYYFEDSRFLRRHKARS